MNTPQMTMDMSLACEAKVWANHLAEQDIFEHSSCSDCDPYGENLAMYYPAYHGPSAPEEMWYEEIGDYDFSTGLHKPELGCSGNFDPNCPMLGHFTQMVWDDSTILGCGEA